MCFLVFCHCRVLCLIIVLLVLNHFLQHLSCLDVFFSFTQSRIYKEGDHDLPSYFQVAKYLVFERVSEFTYQSH